MKVFLSATKLTGPKRAKNFGHFPLKYPGGEGSVLGAIDFASVIGLFNNSLCFVTFQDSSKFRDKGAWDIIVVVNLKFSPLMSRASLVFSIKLLLCDKQLQEDM